MKDLIKIIRTILDKGPLRPMPDIEANVPEGGIAEREAKPERESLQEKVPREGRLVRSATR